MTNLQAGWKKIQTLELGADGTLTFSSIPQTFDHLKAHIQVRSPFVGSSLSSGSMRINGDAGNNYESALNWINSAGTLTNSSIDGVQNAAAIAVIPSANATTTLSNLELIIMGYSDATINKSGSVIGGSWAGSAASEYVLSTGFFRWNGIAAITSLQFARASGAGSMIVNLHAGSRVSMYGLKEATV